MPLNSDIFNNTINNFQAFLPLIVLNFFRPVYPKNTKKKISPPISRLSALFVVSRSLFFLAIKKIILFDKFFLSYAKDGMIFRFSAASHMGFKRIDFPARWRYNKTMQILSRGIKARQNGYSLSPPENFVRQKGFV